MKRTTLLTCILLMSMSLFLTGCKNSDLGLPDARIDWQINNQSSSELEVRLDFFPTLAGNAGKDYILSPQSNISDSYSPYAVRGGEYTIQARAIPFYPQDCNVVMNWSGRPTQSAEYFVSATGEIGNDTPYLNNQISIIVNCFDDDDQLTAQHTTDAVTAQLHPVLSQAKHNQVPTPVILNNANHHTQKLPVQPKQHYQLSVSPLVDSQDKVAHYPKDITTNTKNIKIDYQPSSAHLVTKMALTTAAINQLGLIQQHGYNALIWSGVQLTKHGFSLAKTYDQTDFATVWSQAQAALRGHAYLHSLIELDAKQLAQAPQSTLPTGCAGLALDLSAVTQANSQEMMRHILSWHQQHPSALLVLEVPSALAQDQAVSTLYRALLQPVGKQQLSWQGWVQLPLKSIAANKLGVLPTRLVAVMPKSTDNDLTAYPKAEVNGMVLDYQDLVSMNADTNIKSLVLAPAANK